MRRRGNLKKRVAEGQHEIATAPSEPRNDMRCLEDCAACCHRKDSSGRWFQQKRAAGNGSSQRIKKVQSLPLRGGW